jgi:protein regulator of cytokinesis 1
MARLNERVKQKMIEICSIWVEIGVPRSRRVERIDEIAELTEEEVMGSLAAVIEREEATLIGLRKYKIETIREISKMLNDLRLPPYEVPEGYSLCNLVKLLHYKCKELAKVKDERLQKWSELMASKATFCTRMACESKTVKTGTDIPSEEEISQLQSVVLDLTQMKNQRHKQFEALRVRLSKLFVDTEYEAANDLEKSIFDLNNEFILSEQNLGALDMLARKLTDALANNKKTLEKMLDKLESLWNKLSIDVKEQQTVRKMARDSKPSTLKVLREQIAHLEEIKRQNISMFIAKIRPEVEEWWEKCCISEQEMADFMESHFTDEDHTEQLLDVHEQELERLKNMYKENEEIYVKLSKWRNYWVRLRELEAKSKDPSRFNNRGGALLQEEKERKQLEKGIPKLQTELKQLAAKWSNLHNEQVFTIYGTPIERYFTDYRQMYNQQKETEKKEKKIIKKAEIEAEARGIRTAQNNTLRRTPLKRGNTPAVSSPATCEKQRKMDHFSSVKRSQPEVQTNVVTRKKLTKCMEQEFRSESARTAQKTIVASDMNEENTVINESQFQSVS